MENKFKYFVTGLTAFSLGYEAVKHPYLEQYHTEIEQPVWPLIQKLQITVTSTSAYWPPTST